MGRLRPRLGMTAAQQLVAVLLGPTWPAAAPCPAAGGRAFAADGGAQSGIETPTLAPVPAADGGAPLFRARGLRHPAGVCGPDGTFVPNDIEMGGPHAKPFIVLTGGHAWGEKATHFAGL